METDVVSQKLNELQSYIDRVRSNIEEHKRQIDELERDASNLKRKVAQEISEVAKENQPTSAAENFVDSLEKEYQEKQDEKINEAKQKKEYRSLLERHVSQAENIFKELKTQERTLRELEQKSKTWLNEADQIIGRHA